MSSETTSSDPASEVRAAMAAWLRAFNSGDRVTFPTLYDPEVVYANAGRPLLRGIDDVVASFDDGLADPDVAIEFVEETLFVEGAMALISGSFHFASGGPSGRVALTFRRSTDGRWLLLFDMDNMPPDAAGLRPSAGTDSPDLRR